MDESSEPRVTLYLSLTDPYCHRVHDFLVRRKIDFDVYDVTEDSRALRVMQLISGQTGVPVLVVDNEVYANVDLRQLNALFQRQPRPSVKLGISIANVQPSESYPAGGAYIGRVKKDTPAERAGLQQGDIIIELAQRPVRKAQDVHAVLAEMSIGSRLPITVQRTGRTLRLVVTC
jgi:S1-C subfamily serine protease